MSDLVSFQTEDGRMIAFRSSEISCVHETVEDGKRWTTVDRGGIGYRVVGEFREIVGLIQLVEKCRSSGENVVVAGRMR